MVDDVVGGIIGLVFIFLFIAIGAAIYLLPAIIGFVRKKDNAVAILLLNLFLGWSLIAWVISLVWATSKDQVPQQVVIQNHHSSGPAGGTTTSENVMASATTETESAVQEEQ